MKRSIVGARRGAMLLVSVALASACSSDPAPEGVDANRGTSGLVQAMQRLEKALVVHTAALERAMGEAEPRSVMRPARLDNPRTGKRDRDLGRSIAELQVTAKSIESILRSMHESLRTGPPSTAPRATLQPMATAPSADLKKRFATAEEGSRALKLMSYQDVIRILGAPQLMSGKTVNWFYPHGHVEFVDGYVSRVYFSNRADWRK